MPEFAYWQCPFSVVVDANEGAPYPFKEIRTRASEGRLPVVVRIVKKSLWSMSKRSYVVRGRTYLKGLADYSIEGLEEEIQIERKSLTDLFSSLSGDRDGFEARIMRLNECNFAAVVIEGGYGQILAGVPESRMNPGSVFATILAWQQRYRNVHWLPMPTRAMAEVTTFRILERYWRDRERVATARDETAA